MLDSSAVNRPQPPRPSPMVPPPRPPGIAPVLERNIRALQLRREHEEAAAGWQERTADLITRFTGSMIFVFLHLAGFGFWIIANLGWIPGCRPGIPPSSSSP